MIGSALQSVCKMYPLLVEDYLITPLLSELKSNRHPASAQLLATLSPPPPLLATTVVPSLLTLLDSSFTHSDKHNVTGCMQDWSMATSISSTLLKIVERNAESAPLTCALLDSVVLLSQQVAQFHWVCCIEKVDTFMEKVSSILSLNGRHAGERWVVTSGKHVVEWLTHFLSVGVITASRSWWIQ